MRTGTPCHLFGSPPKPEPLKKTLRYFFLVVGFMGLFAIGLYEGEDKLHRMPPSSFTAEIE